MYVVTGGAGMIGSNVIRQLNLRGVRDILVVDDLKNGRKIFNLADLDISDYISRDNFIKLVRQDVVPKGVRAVFHLGANSSTTEWDGNFLMENNFQYSKDLMHWCMTYHTSFLYASSASVYGLGTDGFAEGRARERPINMYAYSKFIFDEYVRSIKSKSCQIVGLRYFNVYGPREGHKGPMASAVYHFYKQLKANGQVKLFCGTDDLKDGEQRRDFVYVEDCAHANLWFLDHPEVSGIFNIGTGIATTFNELARNVVQHLGGGQITYIPFPDHLRGAYQSYTKADLTLLRNTGCDLVFRDIGKGIKDYLNWAESNPVFQSALK